MLRWIFLFWGICRGRNKPQDLPYSSGLFWLLLFLSIILDVFNLQTTYPSIGTGWSVITVVSHSVIYCSILALFLYLMGFANRINQALNSILGCSLIVGTIATPLYFLVDSSAKAPGFADILILALNIWMLFIIAHILRHALSVAMPVAFILSIGFFMFNMLIGDLFLSDLINVGNRN